MSDQANENVTILSGQLRVEGVSRDLAVASFTPVDQRPVGALYVGRDRVPEVPVGEYVAAVISLAAVALADSPSATAVATAETTTRSSPGERGTEGRPTCDSGTSPASVGQPSLSVDRLSLPAGTGAALSFYGR
jgi:hypothetical protein